MARARILSRLEIALGILGVLALVTSYFLISGKNPLPGLSEAAKNFRSLSRPAPAWTANTGDPPTRAVVIGNTVIIVIRGTVEARHPATGQMLWRKKANWGVVAGDGDTAVVLLGKPQKGFDAVNPHNGTIRWTDDSAVGVWSFRTAVLTATCHNNHQCTVSSRAPHDGSSRWTTGMTKPGHILNSLTLAARDLGGMYADPVKAVPAALPPIFALPGERRVETVDLMTGRRLAPMTVPGNGQATIVGNEILVTTARSHAGECHYTIEGWNPAKATRLWSITGYDPGTVNGSGCDQRRAPIARGRALVATRSDGRATLLNTANGREIWVGTTHHKVELLSDKTAFVTDKNEHKIYAIDTSTGATRWSHSLPREAGLARCPTSIVVIDRETGHTNVYNPESGRQLLTMRLSSDIIGCADSGLILGRARTVGLTTFSGAT